MNKYEKVNEIIKLAKHLQDEDREREAAESKQPSHVINSQQYVVRNYVVEAKEIIEKREKDSGPC